MSTTEGKIVVCPQCGKKYKLKAGFDAASFSCNSCSATVWVKEKRSGAGPVASKRRSARSGGRAAGGHAAGGRAAAGRGRGKGKVEVRAGHIHDHARYSKKDNSTTIFFAAVGVIALGAGVFFLVGGDDEPPPAKPGTSMADAGSGDSAGGREPAPTGKPAAKGAADTGAMKTVEKKPGQPATPTKGSEGPADGASTDDPVREAEAEPSKKLGNTRKKKDARSKGKSKWDPPVDLAHLEDTSPEMRKKIDDLIKVMIDPDAGRDSLDAKEQLIAIGKPAFPRVLGAMAKIRDTITDVDSDEERIIESSLKLADEALREMDGYLTAKGKSTLRPGSEKRYIAYICRLHYKRWVQTLSTMPEMPGPYDPSQEYKGEVEEYR